MKIEILFPEVCSLYGDHGNILLLKELADEAHFFMTPLTKTPQFLNEDIDLIYMGSMSEKIQLKVIEKLMPHKKTLINKLDQGMKAIFTGNATDILGSMIIEEDSRKIEALGLFNFKTVLKRNPRLNSPVLGKINSLEIVGHKSQFTQSYSENDTFFMDIIKGMGINKESKKDGFVYKNCVATHLIGPFLVLNPLFTESFLNVKLKHRDTLIKAYQKKVEDIKAL